jgi:oligoendopeptidase F
MAVDRNEKGEMVELGHSSFSAFLHSPKRDVRKRAFHTYYTQYEAHKNSIAAALNGSVQRDVYYAKARNFPSALESALFGDRVPMSVYDSLIASVQENLPSLYRYYDVRPSRAEAEGHPPVRHVRAHLQRREQAHAVGAGGEAGRRGAAAHGRRVHARTLARPDVRPLVRPLPNAGKQSGAFSYGTFDAEPYIMMNYQPDVLDHVFTLAHEAGHSMHSYYSAKHQPFQYYGYTIFVAEVASTFNEQLLLKHLIAKAKSKKEKAYLINHAIDEIRGTIIRQTMFAEFEKISHALVESGEPLTVETLRRNTASCWTSTSARLRDRRGAGAGVPAHPALLPRVLRLQVRDGPQRRDRPERARHERRRRRN